MRSYLSSPIARALAALGLMLALGSLFNQDGAFFHWSTHRAVLREIAVYGVLASGMTLVIIAGGIDLAVGSLLALSAVSASRLALGGHTSGIMAVVVVMVGGAALGALSGSLVARLRIQPFVVTLAMMVFARGLAKYVAGGKKVTSATTTLPPLFEALDARVFGDNLSVVTVVFLATVALVHLLLTRTRLGRHLRAVGGNSEAARLAGVPIVGVTVAVYALSGILAALAGVCQAAQETHGDPETGAGYELDAIAMVVLGGTPLRGGSGSVLLTLIGALTLGYLQKILSLNAFSTDFRLMLTGVIIVVAVLFQSGRRAA